METAQFGIHAHAASQNELTAFEFDVDKEGKNVILFSYFLILSLIYFLILPY